MEWRSVAAMEEERRVPIRARGAEDGGGAAGPSTVKGERCGTKKNEKLTMFPCRQTLGQAMRRKARRLALAEAPILLSVSYSVNKLLKSVNVCLECPDFNALGAAVWRPQSLARRWAGRCAEWRVAWPWRRWQCKIFCAVSCWQNDKICECFLECAVFNTSGAEVSRPHRVAVRWSGRCAKRRVVWPWPRGHSIFLAVVLCWQNVTFCEVLLEMPSFQCIGGGSVPPPMSCRTLGRAARRNAHRLALAEA